MKFVFQEIFIAVFVLTVLSGGTAFYLAAQPTLSPQQNRIFESATTTWQMGIGAIFALLGSSKATNLLRSQTEADEDETK
jgi:peptidoglycan/LPS O-acetylase OafA/YrhL